MLLMLIIPLHPSSKMEVFICLLLSTLGCVVRSCRGCVGSWDFCLSCDACSSRWLDKGSVLVSMCRWSVLVSAVHPVMILKALFWVVCSFPRFDSDIIGDQTVLAYSMTGKTTALYVARRVSFCFPHDVEVRAFRTFIDESAFSLVILACSAKLRLGSSVRPRILGFLTVGIVTLLIERLSVVFCSRVQDVNKVAVDLSGFSIKSFLLVHSKMS